MTHKGDVCSLYNDIVKALVECGKPLYKSRTKKNSVMPGWNTYVAVFYEQAREATTEWALAGRPRQGPVYENKKLTNARYKYAVRFIRRNEQSMRSESLAGKLLTKNVRLLERNKSSQ